MNNKIAQFPNKIHTKQRIKSNNIATIENYKAKQDREYDKVVAENDAVVHIFFGIIILVLGIFTIYCLKGV